MSAGVSLNDEPVSGFTLFETLIVTSLMAILLAVLSTLTGHWLPNWNRGLTRIQNNEHLALGLHRVVADLAAALYVPNGETQFPVFEGGLGDVIFVRTSVGLDASNLEIVRIAEVNSGQGPVLLRTRLPFSPTPGRMERLTDPSDSVVLLRAPYQIRFAYSGRDRKWRNEWTKNHELPKAVKLTLLDRVTQRLLFTTTTLLNAELSIECVSKTSIKACHDAMVPPLRSASGK